ncbi:TPA: hypothetical protein ACINQS_001710 [Streptococcus agalactiae]
MKVVSKKGICQKCGCTWETPCIDENGVAVGGWTIMRLSVVIVFGN